MDTPVTSNAGLPHALEHLLAGKGTKGRFCTLLTKMQLSVSAAATGQGFNFYEFASGTGMSGFYEQLHAWLDALYRPDFTDLEASREFYHLGVTTEAATGQHSFVEQGTVYDEEQTDDGVWTHYYQLKKRVLGDNNPFGFNTSGNPDAMRDVTPQEIRAFHKLRYRLGPGTGFIFVLSRRENMALFLNHMADELRALPRSENPPLADKVDSVKPKYPIVSSASTEPEIYPYPAENESRPGDIRFAWKPSRTESLLELKLLQLFTRALGDGQKSILYRTVVDERTREGDFGATDVFSDVWLQESPHFPIVNIGISGVPGTRISRDHIKKLRSLILQKISDIKNFPDKSAALRSFNNLIATYVTAWQKDESVWTRNPPLFGYLGRESSWKQHFEYMEMDPSFVRSVTTDEAWNAVHKELASGKNIWKPLIDKFGLLEVPYSTASAPSPTLLRKRATEKTERLTNEITKLISEFHVENPQQALSAFKEQELSHTAVIQKIASEVPRPRFTDNPPLAPDDQAQHRQLYIEGVPAIEVFFERPPTIDLVLSFDLRRIPPRYYRYLPIFPRIVDSLGLRNGGAITSYSALLAEIEKHNYKFSVGYDSDVNSKRVELTIEISALNVGELRESLKLLQKMMTTTNITGANLSRIQDVIAKQHSNDDNYTRQEQMWIREIPTALRYEDDTLLFAMNSRFTRAHWDDRLFWQLHNRVAPRDLRNLSKQLQRALDSFQGMSRQQIETQLTARTNSDLQREVFDYWRRDMNAFPDAELIRGLEKLASEILDDLRKSPATAVSELKQLQQMMFDRNSLRVNIILDKRSQPEVESALSMFVRRTSAVNGALSLLHSRTHPIAEKLKKRYPSFSAEYPLHFALKHEETGTGGAVFTAISPGYGEIDRFSLIKLLAGKRFSGAGPESLYMRTWEVGLAYNNGLISNPRSQLTTYYADRSPDLFALVEFVNSIVSQPQSIQDGAGIDYLLSQAFSVPRSMLTFSDRGIALARDIRDGASPDKIRRFSEAILNLRKDPALSEELSKAEFKSICSVLLNLRCKTDQQAAQSIFFFVGPESLLVGVEKRLGIPDLAYVWPSDFWLQ